MELQGKQSSRLSTSSANMPEGRMCEKKPLTCIEPDSRNLFGVPVCFADARIHPDQQKRCPPAELSSFSQWLETICPVEKETV